MLIPSTNYVPLLSEETMKLHIEKLYKGYLDRFKKLTNDDPLMAILNISHYPISERGDILYNAGGVLNHELYFEELNQHGSHEPKNELKQAIDKKYGSFSNFKKEFIKMAKELVGSGYTFLVLQNNELNIVNMSNQETPYLYDMIPLMNIDLWEHAYYLDYKTNRDAYIEAFFQLLDFDVIENRYDQAVFRKTTTQN